MKKDHNADPVAIFFNSNVLVGVSQTPITKSRHFTISSKENRRNRKSKSRM